MPAGLLLTGGRSERMGRDKATIPLAQSTLAGRVARALGTVAHPVLVVGPEAGTGLPSVDDPCAGPLVAVACGAVALEELGHWGPVLVAACDLPFLDPAALLVLVASLEGADAAVPLVAGRPQWSVAALGPVALHRARTLSALGERKLARLFDGPRVRMVAEEVWRRGVSPEAFTDVDTPADLARALLLAGAEGSDAPDGAACSPNVQAGCYDDASGTEGPERELGA